MLAGQLQPTDCQSATSLTDDAKPHLLGMSPDKMYVYLVCTLRHSGRAKRGLGVGPDSHVARHLCV